MTTERRIDLGALTLEKVLGGALRGHPVTVLGFARSGIALARFLADQGADVTVYDGAPDRRAGRADRGARRPAGPSCGSDPTSTPRLPGRARR